MCNGVRCDGLGKLGKFDVSLSHAESTEQWLRSTVPFCYGVHGLGHFVEETMIFLKQDFCERKRLGFIDFGPNGTNEAGGWCELKPVVW